MNRKITLKKFCFITCITCISVGNVVANAKCALQNIDALWNFFGKEIVYKSLKGFKCDITRSNFTFDLDKNDQKIKTEMSKHITNITGGIFITVEMNWRKNMAKSSLTRQFNMLKLMDYFTDVDYVIVLSLVNLHGFELNLLDQPSDSWIFLNNSLERINLINSDIRFLIDRKEVKTCQEIISSSIRKNNIASLFQIPAVGSHDSTFNKVFLFGCRFKQILCPLVFTNSNLRSLILFDQANTFYKTNLLRFSNETFNYLNSSIKRLHLFRSLNLALDTRFLHPSVFNKL